MESAAAGLAEIDTALGPLPADAPEAAMAKQEGISALELEIQSAPRSLQSE